MKTLFITVSESSVANNLLRGDFFRLLRGANDLRVILIAPESAVAAYAQEFGRERVFVLSMPSARRGLREKINNFLARNVLRTRMVHLLQMRQFLDDKKRFSYALKRALATVFGRSRVFQTIVRMHERTLPMDSRIRALFSEYKPDLVFATVANYINMDVPLLREAQKRGIATIGMMRGWDAFPAHGFLRVIPDIMLLQNEYMRTTGRRYQFIPEARMRVIGTPAFDWHFRKDLLKSREEFCKDIGIDPAKKIILLQNEYMRTTGRRYQFIPEARMRVIGTPAFDWHFRKDLLKSREEFCKDIGIDPAKKIILFGAMEYYWYPRDADIARIFDDVVASEKISKDAVMLFRPHPGYEGPIERVKALLHVIPDMASFTRVQGDNVQMREKQMSHFLNSLFHSSIVVSVASTIALDGIGFGKPAISIAFEEAPHPYWESIGRFHTHDTHFMDAFKTGAIARVYSREEFARCINRYLSNPDEDGSARDLLRRGFLEPYDGKTGERIYKEITRALGI